MRHDDEEIVDIGVRLIQKKGHNFHKNAQNDPYINPDDPQIDMQKRVHEVCYFLRISTVFGSIYSIVKNLNKYSQTGTQDLRDVIGYFTGYISQ